jgi:hypothetical protein
MVSKGILAQEHERKKLFKDIGKHSHERLSRRQAEL